MSAKAETRGLGGMLIFCIVFLGIFIALAGVVPSEFFVQTKTYTQYDYPEYFTPEDVQTIKHFLNRSIQKDGPEIVFDFNAADNPVNFKFHMWWWEVPELPSGGAITAHHRIWELWIFYKIHAMKIPNGIFFKEAWWFDKTLIASNYDDETKASIFYPVKCEHITIKIWVTDYNATRKDLSAAWDEGKVMVGIGFGFEDYQTKLSAWDIIGRLLTFQSPEVFGLSGAAATILNLVVALPVWTSIAYLVYRLILMAIPFV